MIYTVIKDEVSLEIDDIVFFEKQSKEFRALFNQSKDDENTADMDNCTITLFPSGRLIIIKKEDDEL